MRGLNRVSLSGNVSGNIVFDTTEKSSPACSFNVASDRHTGGGVVVTVWVKINVYGEGLVGVCRDRIQRGSYVIVDGELMNRSGKLGELTEVRARELIVINGNKQGQTV